MTIRVGPAACFIGHRHFLRHLGLPDLDHHRGRARRIIPALIAVLLASLAAGWVLLLAAAAFVSN